MIYATLPITYDIDTIFPTKDAILICLLCFCLNHIKFWKDSLPEVNGNQFTSDLSGQSIVYIDASNTGYGGYIVETSTNIAHDM
jgi:hypothetical protein